MEPITLRTHIKVLIPPAVLQIALLAAHGIIFWAWDANTSNQWINQWAGLITHTIILIFEIYYVIVPILKWRNHIFTIHPDKLTAQWGVLYKHSREIPLQRISSISEERGILDRIFGAGTLNFYDAASTAQPHTSGAWNNPKQQHGIQFKDIPNVTDIKHTIENLRNHTMI